MKYIPEPLLAEYPCSQCRKTKYLAEFKIRTQGSRRGKPFGICKDCKSKRPKQKFVSQKHKTKSDKKRDRRDLLISKIFGLSGWHEFKRSNWFKEIRRKALDKNGRYCECCAEFAYMVYLTRFDEPDLTGSFLGNIHPICEKCLIAIMQFSTIEDCNRQLYGMVDMGEEARKVKYAHMYEAGNMKL
jgi:hypothetical protein